MHKKFLEHIDVPTLDSPDSHTWEGYTECPICKQRFDTDSTGNAVWKLTQHLVRNHGCSGADLRRVYEIDVYEDDTHRCLCCGTEFNISLGSWAALKREPNKVSSCCSSCARALQNLMYNPGFGNVEVKAKADRAIYDKYGVHSNLQIPSVIEKRVRKWKDKQTEIIAKMSATCMEKNGVPYACMLEQCRMANRYTISKVNQKFASILEELDIETKFEYRLENKVYDLFIVGTNLLVELDPTYTHNSTVGPKLGARDGAPAAVNSHLLKSQLAWKHNMHCIHIFDWDNWEKVIQLLLPRVSIGARKCTVKPIAISKAHEFCIAYHLQGKTHSAKYAYGLYFNDELVQVMTFGNPRYNKNYEYELLRLCTKPEYQIVGGANRLLKAFIGEIHPKSIITYCDLAKFTGNVYKQMGFSLVRISKPSCHWQHMKSGRHITDGELRRLGYDKLHNASYGKGTNNAELMLANDYVQVYDVGQATYELRL